MLDIVERMQILVDTTFEDYPLSSIEFEYKEAIKEMTRLRALVESLKQERDYWEGIAQRGT